MQTEDNACFHIVLVKGWVKKNNKYLLARRGSKEVHVPGVWSLPGGKVDDTLERDILQNTLKAEIKEEVGIDIMDEMSLVYNNSFRRVDDAHVVGLTFLCHHKSGEAQPLEDTDEVKWLSLQGLSELSDIKDFLKVEIEALKAYTTNER